MKNRCFLFVFMITIIFLAGCGKAETAPTDTFWDIAVEICGVAASGTGRQGVSGTVRGKRTGRGDSG